MSGRWIALGWVLTACAAHPVDATAQPVSPPPPAALAVQAAEPALVPATELVVSAEDGASAGAARLLAQIEHVRTRLVETKYQARTEVRADHGYYAWDCSGMVTWLLGRAAPRAVRALRSSRPTARDYYRAIAGAPQARARAGWRRLAHVRDARPGDVFAFPKSKLSSSKITGHVGVIMSAPVEVPQWPGAFAVRILDATRLPHQDDSRTDDGVGGFGFGTMLFVTDEDGEAQAYGWFGTQSAGLMPTHIVFGRVSG